MDLEQLKFVVDTTELAKAAKEIDALGASVSKLNKPLQELSKNSEKVAQSSTKVAKATEAKNKASEKEAETASRLAKLYENLTNKYSDMSAGSTSAEAGVLKLARSFGATTEDALKPFKAVLEEIRSLSKSPFDSAIGSVRSITQEYDALNQRAELAAKGIYLTTNQLKEFSKISNELKGQFKAAQIDVTGGEGLTKFNAELKKQQDVYLGIATNVNTLKAAEKDRNDILNTQLKEQTRLQQASDNLFKYNQLRHAEDQKGYKQDMVEMNKYYSELERKSLVGAANEVAALQKSSDELFKLNQLKQESTKKVYQQDMLAMREYYSNLEKESKRVEDTRVRLAQEASDSLFKLNQIRQQQEQQGYDSTMLAMRKYYAALEKEANANKPSKSGATSEFAMDKASEQFYKNQIKAQKDAAKAAAYVADVETRLAAALDATNSALDKQATDGLVKYEKALKAAGFSADQAAIKLAATREQFNSVADKKQAAKLQYLARAISVQMGDVGISLASGMNPLLVMIQQGDQIRGAIQQAGASGKELEKAMGEAAGQIAMSFLDTGKAIGGFFVNAIKSSGKAITDFAMQITGTEQVLERMRYSIALLAGSDSKLMSVFKAAATGLQILSGVLLVTAIAGLVALAKGLYDVIKQQDALTTQLVLTGASLGVNTTQATSYANSLNAVGVTTNSALKIIAAMAKEGGFLANEITMVVTAANNLKFAGVAIEDTVKQFAKLKEKPVEALIEIAKATGLVKPEIVALVSELEMQGKTSQAAAIAMKAYADVTVQQKDRLKNELSGFAVFMKTLSSSVGEFFDEVFRGLFRKASPTEAIKREIKDLENTINLGTQASDKTKAENQAKLGLLKEQLQLSQRAADAELTRSSDNIRAAKALGEWQKLSITNLDEQKKAEKDIENIRKVGLEAKKSEAEIEKLIADYKEKNKKAKPAKTDQEKEELRLLKESEKYLSRVSSLTNAAIKEQEEYTKAQKLALDIFSDPDFKNYPEAQRIKIANAIELAHNEEVVAKSLDVQRKELEKLMQVQKKADDIVTAAWTNMEQLNKQVLDQTQLLELEGSLIGATAAERKKALGIKRLDLKLEEEIADIKKRALPELEQEDMINQARQRRLANEKNLNTEIAIDAATKTLEEYNKIADGITDSIVTALIEGGESGGKKLRSILEAELRRPITVFVRAIVDSLTGGATGAAASAGGNFLSSMGGSLISSTLGSISVGGGSLAAAGSAFGTGFMTTLQGGSVAEAAGIYSAAGMQGVSTGLSAGASLAGAVPYVAAAIAIANALGLFKSTKQVGGGISGILGASTPTSEVAMSGFSGKGRTRTVSNDIQQYALMREGGSLIDGPNYYRQTQGTFAGNAALQQTFDQLKASTKAMADTLKLSSAGIEDFTKTIDISFDGLTDAQIQEKIASTFASVNDELAALVLGAGATAEQLSTLYNNVMQQRYDLETQLLELQGKTLELRERERAKIYDVNKEMFDQIKALEDQKSANEAAAVAMEKLTSVTTTIVDEINRLRGVSQTSSGLESQFAILTAQARSGDLTALAQLPEVTKGLEQIAASSAVNATDIIFARARLAQSLQDTLGYFPAGTLSTATTSVATLPSVATASAGASVSAASSNQELLAALVIEVQGLRAEVRADVSHNAKTAKILERVNQDGETLSVSATIDGGAI